MTTRADYQRMARGLEQDRRALLERARGRTLTREEQREYDALTREQRKAEQQAQEARS